MSIDWITVAAQIANFLVLVWLLKKFLYRPILDGIDAREAEIKDRMGAAIAAKAAAEAAETEFHAKTNALNLAQAEMTETIRKTAEAQRDVLLKDARAKMESEHVKWQTHLDEETAKYGAKLEHAGAAALLSLTQKALNDLSDETFEARMAQHLIHKIKPMEDDLRRAAGAASEAVITSQAPLSDHVKTDLTAQLQALFPQTAVRFAPDEAQSPGLVLRIGGAQVAWTVDSYIDGLGGEIAAQIKQKAH